MDGDDLVVLFALIDHLHHADRHSNHDRQRHHALLPEYQYVEGVVIVAESLWNEPVICGIVHGTEQDAVDANESALLVELVLRFRALRYFDDHRHDVRRALADGDIVPRMHRGDDNTEESSPLRRCVSARNSRDRVRYAPRISSNHERHTSIP